MSDSDSIISSDQTYFPQIRNMDYKFDPNIRFPDPVVPVAKPVARPVPKPMRQANLKDLFTQASQSQAL